MNTFPVSLPYNKEAKNIFRMNRITRRNTLIMKQDKIKIKGLKIKSIIKLTPKNGQANQSPKGGGYTWVG